MAQTTTLKKFESIFPKLVEDILDHAKQYKLPEEFVSWYKAVSISEISFIAMADFLLVHECKHNWRKMQSRNVCPRLGFHAP
jgi:hypothetical protein